MTAAVIASCADHYGILVEQLLGRGRSRKVVRARQAAMFVFSRRDLMSTPAIGRIMDRDHSTVVHGIQVVESKRGGDRQLDALVTTLMALPRYHREVTRVVVPDEVQLELREPAPLMVSVALPRRRNPHPAVCTVQRKPKNDLSPDDHDALARMRGTDKLLSAMRAAGFA